MKPKLKAKEIVDKMYQYQWRKDTIEFRNAKQCALIAVDEILTFIYVSELENKYWINYWNEVKQEIEKL